MSNEDKEFVTKAGIGGLAEVQMGKLALQKASNAEVKAFAGQGPVLLVADSGLKPFGIVGRAVAAMEAAGLSVSVYAEIVGEPPSAYKARDHSDLQVVPGCQAMVLTRPRREYGREIRIGEASGAPPA